MTASRETPKEGICSLCGGRYDDYGHNPAPLGKVNARCCTQCNETRVLYDDHDMVRALQQRAARLQCWIDECDDEDALEMVSTTDHSSYATPTAAMPSGPPDCRSRASPTH
jgi:hypothetical protein